VPTPEQRREMRLQELLKEFDGKTVSLVDTIYRRTLDKYPYLREEKAMEYAQTIFRILKAKEKEKK